MAAAADADCKAGCNAQPQQCCTDAEAAEVAAYLQRVRACAELKYEVLGEVPVLCKAHAQAKALSAGAKELVHACADLQRRVGMCCGLPYVTVGLHDIVVNIAIRPKGHAPDPQPPAQQTAAEEVKAPAEPKASPAPAPAPAAAADGAPAAAAAAAAPVRPAHAAGPLGTWRCACSALNGAHVPKCAFCSALGPVTAIVGSATAAAAAAHKAAADMQLSHAQQQLQSAPLPSSVSLVAAAPVTAALTSAAAAAVERPQKAAPVAPTAVAAASTVSAATIDDDDNRPGLSVQEAMIGTGLLVLIGAITFAAVKLFGSRK